jgi:regulator of protease activity HflC (stomatin/prohibitin superfamily)
MKKTINEGFNGILYKKGIIQNILGPGRHNYSVFGNESIEVFDTRIMTGFAAGSAATTDNVSISASVQYAYQIVDLKRYVLSASNPATLINGIGTDAIGKAIAGKTLENIEAEPEQFYNDFKTVLTNGLAVIGIKVIEVFSPNITIPKNIRNAAEAQSSAKKKALAELEEARGRTAVLRHYANTTDIIKDNPEILQLLISQKAKNIHIDFSKPDKS